MSITTSTRRYTPKEQMILDAGIAMGKEEERKRITEEITAWHKELLEELKDKPGYDAYSDDYKHGILRGYTLVGRYLEFF